MPSDQSRFHQAYRQHLLAAQRQEVLRALRDALDPETTLGEIVDAAESLGWGEPFGDMSLADLADALIEAPIERAEPAPSAEPRSAGQSELPFEPGDDEFDDEDDELDADELDDDDEDEDEDEDEDDEDEDVVEAPKPAKKVAKPLPVKKTSKKVAKQLPAKKISKKLAKPAIAKKVPVAKKISKKAAVAKKTSKKAAKKKSKR